MRLAQLVDIENRERTRDRLKAYGAKRRSTNLDAPTPLDSYEIIPRVTFGSIPSWNGAVPYREN